VLSAPAFCSNTIRRPSGKQAFMAVPWLHQGGRPSSIPAKSTQLDPAGHAWPALQSTYFGKHIPAPPSGPGVQTSVHHSVSQDAVQWAWSHPVSTHSSSVRAQPVALVQACTIQVHTAGSGVQTGVVVVVIVPPSGSRSTDAPPVHAEPLDLHTREAGQSALVPQGRLTGLQVPLPDAGQTSPLAHAGDGGRLHAESAPQSASVAHVLGAGAQTPVDAVVTVDVAVAVVVVVRVTEVVAVVVPESFGAVSGGGAGVVGKAVEVSFEQV